MILKLNKDIFGLILLKLDDKDIVLLSLTSKQTNQIIKLHLCNISLKYYLQNNLLCGLIWFYENNTEVFENAHLLSDPKKRIFFSYYSRKIDITDYFINSLIKNKIYDILLDIWHDRMLDSESINNEMVDEIIRNNDKIKFDRLLKSRIIHTNDQNGIYYRFAADMDRLIL